MRAAVFGAGAIGGYLAAKLAAKGDVDISLVARGAHLDAIRADGLTLIENGERKTFRIAAGDDASVFGPQDYVFLTLKAHSISATLDQIAPLLGPDTAVVTMQNGVPWWYFYGVSGPLADTRIASVDPDGRIWDQIGPSRVIGSVVYPAAEIDAPGVVHHLGRKRFSLGEPDNTRSDRVTRLSTALIAAGLEAPVRTDIRSEIWVKLWGNLAFNPISALTGSTLEALVGDPGTRAVVAAMMTEAQEIGVAFSIRFPVTIDQRIAGAGELGAHKTSMLQDLERNRPMEIDALVTAVQELARLKQIETPTIDTVLALVRRLAVERGLYTPPKAAGIP